jgi:hypothetical protein
LGVIPVTGIPLATVPRVLVSVLSSFLYVFLVGKSSGCG